MNVFNACTKKLAAKSAQSLPEHIPRMLFVVYCLAVSQPCKVAQTEQEYFEYLGSFFEEIKVMMEAAEHRGNRELPDDLTTELFILLEEKECSCDLRKISRLAAECVENGEIWRLDREDLKAASDRFRGEVIEWLKKIGAPVPAGKTLRLAESSVMSALKPFVGEKDFFLAPQLPPEKLLNAIDRCGVPLIENVIAFVDCTFFGSAKDAVIIGCRGVYFHQNGMFGFIPYSELVEHSILVQSQTTISLGPEHLIDVTGSDMPVGRVAELLERSKRVALQQHRRSFAEVPQGLDSVRGMPALIKMLKSDVVGPLKQKEKYLRYGLSIPNGLLLYGPPGCGKTYLARHLATELGYNFQEVIPSTVASPYIHETVRMISEIFATAARHAPTMLFVDEFDGLVPSRDGLGIGEEHKAEEVNEWLTQIGTAADRGIFFVAATNFPWKIDIAARRSGRLDKKVLVRPPVGDGLRDILEFHMRGRPHTGTSDIEKFSAHIDMSGFSSSDLKLIADEAARLAMLNDEEIGYEHLMDTVKQRVRPSISSEMMTPYEEF